MSEEAQLVGAEEARRANPPRARAQEFERFYAPA